MSLPYDSWIEHSLSRVWPPIMPRVVPGLLGVVLLIACVPLQIAAAGTIYVSTSADNVAVDEDITLREALLIARGSRGFGEDEAPHVEGTVGAGIDDSILVALDDGAVIALSAALPPLDDAEDELRAGSLVVVDGSALTDPAGTTFAFDLSTDNHWISGLTLRGFPGTAVRIRSAGNTIRGMLIEDSGKYGIEVDSQAAHNNTITNCSISGSYEYGLFIHFGAHDNIIDSVFVFGGSGTGVIVMGAGTDGNLFTGCGFGLQPVVGQPDVFVRKPNQGYGLTIFDRASRNRVGDPQNPGTFTYVSNNEVGGILIEGEGTNDNVLHSLWLGYDSDDPSGVGNGFGPGIRITGGAKRNVIGMQGWSSFVVFSGHRGNCIEIEGVGTDDNRVLRTFLGGMNPNVWGFPLINRGHGIVIRDGAAGTILGGTESLTQIEADFLGTEGTEHYALWIDGNNASVPIRNTRLQYFHMGRESWAGPSVQGDLIHVSGNVDTVDLGYPGHENSACGATGYAISITGPDVKNVTLHRVVAGDWFGYPSPNGKGGILVADGAENVTISAPGAEHRSCILSNDGPGIVVDATEQAPVNLHIQNCWIGHVSYEGHGEPELQAYGRNNGPGIFVQGPADDSTEIDLVIGSADDEMLGNLICVNVTDGIRLQNVEGVEIHGNRIGTDPEASEAHGNGERGINVDHCTDIRIGSDTDDSPRNIISGNELDGVVIDAESSSVRLYRNYIGCGLDPETEIPNEHHGVLICGGATNNLLEKNTIYYNKKDGIHVCDAETRLNTFRNNSIHRNEEEGIAILDGAQDGIEPPQIDRVILPGTPRDMILCITDPLVQTMEVFVDPLAPWDKPGTFGQAKERVHDLGAFIPGAFVIPMNFDRPGIITATATDDQGNTSALSPFASAMAIQVVKTQDNLLVAHKPTAVRVFADVGLVGGNRLVTGELSINDSGRISPEPLGFWMRSRFAYADRPNLRRVASNSLNFLVRDPAEGTQEWEVTLREPVSGHIRGRVRMGEFNFRKIEPFRVGFSLVRAPDAHDHPPLHSPSIGLVIQAARYFSAIFPFDPRTFSGRVHFLQGITLGDPPHTNLQQFRLAQQVERLRVGFRHPTGGTLRWAAGVVSEQTALEAPGTGFITMGFTFPAIPQTVIMMDNEPGSPLGHNGPTLIHEIGHTPPFNLGDTYTGPSSSPAAINPHKTGPGESDVDGNFVLEKHQAFDPLRIMPVYGLDGPVYTSGGNIVRDFMGGRSPAWTDDVTYKILFNAMVPPPPDGQGTTTVPLLMVQGEITVDQQARLGPIDPFDGELDDLIVPDGSQIYTLELQNVGGEVLDARTFGLDFIKSQTVLDTSTGQVSRSYPAVETIPFSVALLDDPLGARIVLKNGDLVLASLDKSASTPTVQLLAPHGPGVLPDESVEVRWMADDADPGDAAGLVFDVFYMPDDETRLPVAVGLTGVDAVVVPTALLPAGPAPRFIVRASDGWNIAEDASDPALTVVDRLPQVEIVEPTAETFLTDANPVALNAVAYDAEDGLFSDEVVWTLDDDPDPIATGAQAVVLLGGGEHVIRASVTDSADQRVSDEQTISVRIDCVVTLEDFVQLAQAWRSTAAGDLDMDDSGQVDLGELRALAEFWLGSCPPRWPFRP